MTYETTDPGRSCGWEFSTAMGLTRRRVQCGGKSVVPPCDQSLPSKPVHAKIEDGAAVFSYTAQDGIQSKTVARLTSVSRAASQPCRDAEADADTGCIILRHRLTVPGRGEAKWTFVIDVAIDGNRLSEHSVHGSSDDAATAVLATSAGVQKAMVAAKQRVADSYRDWLVGSPNVTGNAAFSNWYGRGLLDLRMLVTDIGCGPFAVARVPWFAVLFGRDSLLSAMQSLCVHPEVPKGTLRRLNSFYGQYNAYWNSVLAGVILLTIPMVVVFVIFQKQFVKGVATTGLK